MGIISIIFSIIGAIELIFGVTGANGAPQQAAAAGIAIALSVIPYTIFKVMHCKKVEENQEEIIKLLKSKKEGA